MKRSMKIGAVILGMGVVLAVYEFYDFKSEEYSKLESERSVAERKQKAKQEELRRLQDFAKNIETIKQELKEVNLQLDLAMEHMPRTFNLSGLLRKLSMLAQNSGLDIFTFKPATAEEKVAGAFYATTTIDMDLKGTYAQILVFFDQVSRLKRVVNAEDLRITMDHGGARRTGPPLINVVAKMRTYRFSE